MFPAGTIPSPCALHVLRPLILEKPLSVYILLATWVFLMTVAIGTTVVAVVAVRHTDPASVPAVLSALAVLVNILLRRRRRKN
jgi:hypothetical protein